MEINVYHLQNLADCALKPSGVNSEQRTYFTSSLLSCGNPCFSMSQTQEELCDFKTLPYKVMLPHKKPYSVFWGELFSIKEGL